MVPADFEYITANVAGPGMDSKLLDEDFEGCQCLGECTSAGGCGCLPGGKDNYDLSTGKFSHESDSEHVHLECHQNCNCAWDPEKCANRRIQYGVKVPVKIAPCAGGKGLGVFATDLIEAGQFVVEYVGEVLGEKEAKRRLERLRHDEHNYLFTIREYIRGECRLTFIDARHRGNLSRFINHSCEPNMALQVFRLGRQSPSLAMFAARDIQPGEELSYSYGFLSGSDGAFSAKTCLCGAPSCQGRLPSASDHSDGWRWWASSSFSAPFPRHLIISPVSAQQNCHPKANVSNYFVIPSSSPDHNCSSSSQLALPERWASEFKRIDSSGDDQITFSEFLLSDRPWMETMSRRFHTIDANSDGRVTRREYDAFFRGRDEEQERQRNQANNFFKQLTVTVGPIVEREQEGDAQNGSSRMRYFRAGSRKYAAITHGTGLFPPPSSAPSSSVDLPPSLFRDHDHHFHNIFQSHPQFLLPSSPSMLGPHQPDGRSSEQQSTSSGGPAQAVQQRERALKNEGPPGQI